jgi:GDP-D-mannose 3',5'-epimerase
MWSDGGRSKDGRPAKTGDRMTGVVVMAGGGGFIGGHLARRLLDQGREVRVVDCRPVDEWHQVHSDADNRVLDLRLREACDESLRGAGEVFNLACDMGGMGFIENNRALCMLSVLINTHLLQAAVDHDLERYFYASSACVYAAGRQRDPDNPALKEEHAYPAEPEDGYGWEKLFSERMCRHFTEDFGLVTRVARFHNVYGPHGTWDGGREKAPAAICRKVATAALTGEKTIEIWGDGGQTRSFMWIDDCLDGIELIHASDLQEPVNLGSSERVSINQLVDTIEDIAGVRLAREYDLGAPKGVNGRNSDNTMILDRLGWEPSTPLQTGLERTYTWIHGQVARSLGRGPGVARTVRDEGAPLRV